MVGVDAFVPQKNDIQNVLLVVSASGGQGGTSGQERAWAANIRHLM